MTNLIRNGLKSAQIALLPLAAVVASLGTSTPAQAQNSGGGCWFTHWWDAEYWEGTAGYCQIDGRLWWFDFDGGYGSY